MKTAGIILLVLGIVGTIVFGIEAIQQSETISFLGIEIAATTANWTPVIISVILLVVGIILMGVGRKQTA